LLDSLRSQPYARLARQWFVVDACADVFRGQLPEDDPKDWVTFPTASMAETEQCVLLAAKPWGQAHSVLPSNMGVFTRAMLDALARVALEPWPPDFKQVAKESAARLAGLLQEHDVRQYSPSYLWRRGPHEEELRSLSVTRLAPESVRLSNFSRWSGESS